MQRLFTDTKIFNEDFNVVTNEDAREYYISGDAKQHSSAVTGMNPTSGRLKGC